MKPSPHKLSYRMKVFIENALKSQPFWDICCDHGYAGLGARASGDFSEVHFVDQIPHIIKKLEAFIEKGPDYETPFVLYSQPAETLKQKITGTFLVAGVGGLNIKNIIEPLLESQLLQCERLLLSPHTNEKVLIQFLESEMMKKTYILKEKILIPERKKIRSLYVLDLKLQ